LVWLKIYHLQFKIVSLKYNSLLLFNRVTINDIYNEYLNSIIIVLCIINFIFFIKYLLLIIVLLYYIIDFIFNNNINI